MGHVKLKSLRKKYIINIKYLCTVPKYYNISCSTSPPSIKKNEEKRTDKKTE